MADSYSLVAFSTSIIDDQRVKLRITWKTLEVSAYIFPVTYCDVVGWQHSSTAKLSWITWERVRLETH